MVRNRRGSTCVWRTSGKPTTTERKRTYARMGDTVHSLKNEKQKNKKKTKKRNHHCDSGPKSLTRWRRVRWRIHHGSNRLSGSTHVLWCETDTHTHTHSHTHKRTRNTHNNQSRKSILQEVCATARLFFSFSNATRSERDSRETRERLVVLGLAQGVVGTDLCSTTRTDPLASSGYNTHGKPKWSPRSSRNNGTRTSCVYIAMRTVVSVQNQTRGDTIPCNKDMTYVCCDTFRSQNEYPLDTEEFGYGSLDSIPPHVPGTRIQKDSPRTPIDCSNKKLRTNCKRCVTAIRNVSTYYYY